MRVTDEMVDAYWDAFIKSTGTTLEDIRAGFEAALAVMPKRAFTVKLLRDIDRLAARLAAAEAEKKASYPAEAVIEGPNIVIRVPISAIPVAFKASPETPRNDEGDPTFRVTDADLFAKGVVRYLNEEEEDGTTRIHQMLDSAMLEALEQGGEGLEEIAAIRSRKGGENG